jgi:hypothetical protein
MATKKPWRTVLTGTSTGRFTREQIREAMDSVSSRGSTARTDGGASKNDGSARGKSDGEATRALRGSAR